MTLQDELKRWEEQTLVPLTEKSPERKPKFETSSGIELPRLALPADADPDYAGKIGFPGEYPFTRGVPLWPGTLSDELKGRYDPASHVLAAPDQNQNGLPEEKN